MPENLTTNETESPVQPGGLWLPLLAGTVFVLIGTTILLAAPRTMPRWFSLLFVLSFAGFGGALLLVCLRHIARPAHIRHASADVLPDVPAEPVPAEGSLARGRVTHELVETPEGWEFRPSMRLWRSDQRFLLGFGIPFLTGFAALLAWLLHSQLGIPGWVIPAMLGVLATSICGGSVFLLFAVIMRASYRPLVSLTIPRSGDHILLDEPEVRNFADTIFAGKIRKKRSTIPRSQVAAVQLCPWKMTVGGSGHRSTTWAVQGLLVLAPAGTAGYQRLPILLTSDAVNAARLMRNLADTLNVPFLFHADRAGWQAEEARARTRPPLQSGGMVT